MDSRNNEPDSGSIFDKSKIPSISTLEYYLLIPETDKKRLETLANDIMNLDNRIFTCNIVSCPDGSDIARVVRTEFQQSLSSLAPLTGGMAGHWVMSAFHTMKRLDAFRSKTRFLAVGRETNMTLIFPFNTEGTLMIIMTILAKTEPTEIFEIVTRFIKASNLTLTV
jgi:hypothetical protein